MVATALKNGISQCVSINLVGGLDTHFGTQTTHASNLRAGFDALGLAPCPHFTHKTDPAMVDALIRDFVSS